jgi:hypothetical protein
MFGTEHTAFEILIQYTRGGHNMAHACDRWSWLNKYTGSLHAHKADRDWCFKRFSMEKIFIIIYN